MVLEFHFTSSDAKNILKTLILCETVIVCIYLLSYLLGKPSFTIQALFDLDGEACIPAWFSSMQLFLTGSLLWLAGRSCRQESPSPFFLRLAGAGFVFVSADEAAMIHERIGSCLRTLPHVPTIHGHGAWISLYLVGGLLFLLAMRRHLLALWRDFRPEVLWALAGMALFLLGALGFEVLGDLLRSGSFGQRPRLYVLEVAMEEFCEMSGMSVLLYGVMRFLLQLQREKRRAALPLVAVASPAGSSLLQTSGPAAPEQAA